MIQFLKYVKGYLRIRVKGFSPERFMNLCSNRGILLWDIQKDGEVYEMCISLNGFLQLRPIARKTQTKAVVLERYGLPFLAPKLLKRKVFVLGLFLAVGFWIWSSMYIWRIELTGNYQITRDVFDTFLEEQGVSIGMRQDGLDIQELEKRIRRQFPLVTWASARLTGTSLKIDIKENDTPAQTEEPARAGGTDLVAEFEGTVVSIIVRNGTPKVSIGDTVEKGTVLVDGKIPIYNEDATVREYRYVEADADIVLEHAASFSRRLPFDYVKKVYTGREKQSHYLRVGNREWKLPSGQPFFVYDSLTRESRPLLFEKLSIPIFWGSRTCREYQDVEFVYTAEEAKTLLTGQFITFLTSLEEKGVQIIEKNVKIETGSTAWVLRGELLVREKAGEKTATAPPGDGELETDEQ